MKSIICAVLAVGLIGLVPGVKAENLLKDPGFAAVGQPGAAWQTVLADKASAAEPIKATDGSVAGLRLKNAQATQTVTLPEGLFELTVTAKGQSELLLKVAGAGERTQALNKDDGVFGYLFQAVPGATAVSVGVSVDGTLTKAELQPATDAQKTAWTKEQESIRQFGFITVSAQRPTPGEAALSFIGEAKPLLAMTQRVVLDDPRLNTAHVQNVDRLVNWLGVNGFERLDGDKLPAWMQARIKAGDAYGSVAVLPRGVTPIGIYFGAEETKPLWLEYLRAGGRLVHIGDLPLNYAEYPGVEPPALDNQRRGAGLLGLAYGWNSPYWGQGGLTVTPTAAAKAWGLEIMDGAITGIAVECVSLTFGEYTVPATGKKGAACWFKNVRPDLPWSGLIKIQQQFDGASDVALRDIWRAANYTGTPVTVPPLPPPLAAKETPALAAVTKAGGMDGRREWVRGEKVTVTAKFRKDVTAEQVRCELSRDGKTVFTTEQPVENGTAAFGLDTSSYAYGSYDLTLTAVQAGKTVATASEKCGIRYIPPEGFNWEAWTGAGSNPVRTDNEFADIKNAGMEVYLVSPDVAGVDACVRNGLGFSLRAHPDFTGGKEAIMEKNPEYFRIDQEGKPVGTAYSGGRPSIGISHPDIRKNSRESFKKYVETVAGIPAFRPYVICNDDFSIYYGWDYAPHVLEAFKKDTGLEAPRKMIKPEKFGAMPENQPWYQWFRWTLTNVDGAFNKAETDGAIDARADVRTGPIPGGMQIPLVLMWEPAQYPTFSFGPNGFNLICSYYYNTYWQPVMTISFWMEIGRMGNRDLPEWCMPDAFMTAGYTRDSLFHYFAGGAKGLAYFTYSSRNDNSWPEFRRLGNGVVCRLGSVQPQLKPDRKAIGMLNSFTSNCFDPGHTLVQAYGYHNLIQGHFDVEMVSEEDVLAGQISQYRAILLYFVQYLRQPVYDALAAYAAKGGMVLLDNTVPFDIPGAKRLAVDIGMGKEQTKGVPPEGAHASVPGIRDYGIPERIAVIKKVLSAEIKPQFESDDIKLGAWRFAAAGVPYTWFVNIHDGKEYMFCRERMGAGHPGSGTPEKVQQVRDWETAEMAKGPYTSTVVYETLSGIPYDLVTGKKVPVGKRTDGRFEVKLSMDRFGGALVAWLPEEIKGMNVDAPKTAVPGTPVKFAATVAGKAGPLAGVLPVEFTLKDPAGAVSVISGVRATGKGQAVLEWTPASNDLVGKWTLQVTDLTSGKTAAKSISLKAK